MIDGIRNQVGGALTAMSIQGQAKAFRQMVINNKTANKNMRIDDPDTTIKYIKQEADEVVDAYYSKDQRKLEAEMGDLGATLEMLSLNMRWQRPHQQALNVSYAFNRLTNRVKSTLGYMRTFGEWGKAYQAAKDDYLIACGWKAQGTESK